MFGRRTKSGPAKRQPLTNLEDLRDDCIALWLNSGLTMKQAHERGGPTPQTISKWLYKETRFPRLDTMRALMRALDADMVVMPYFEAKMYREQAIADRLGLDISVDSRPKMPSRAKKAKTRASA